MDKFLSLIFDDESNPKIVRIIFIVLLSIVSAGNIVELFNFLKTIPVLEWLLNKEVLRVFLVMSLTLLTVNLLSYFSDLKKVYFKQNKTFDKDIDCFENASNGILKIGILINSSIIMIVVTKFIVMSFFILFICPAVLIIMFLIYSFIYNKWKKEYELFKQNISNN